MFCKSSYSGCLELPQVIYPGIEDSRGSLRPLNAPLPNYSEQGSVCTRSTQDQTHATMSSRLSLLQRCINTIKVTNTAAIIYNYFGKTALPGTHYLNGMGYVITAVECHSAFWSTLHSTHQTTENTTTYSFEKKHLKAIKFGVSGIAALVGVFTVLITYAQLSILHAMTYLGGVSFTLIDDMVENTPNAQDDERKLIQQYLNL